MSSNFQREMPSNYISNHGELRSFEFKFKFIYSHLFNYNTTTIRKKNTNRRTDREQYTRSNAATARLLTSAKPAET